MDALLAAKVGAAAHQIYKSVGGWLEKRRKDRLVKWFSMVCSDACWGASPEIVQEEIRRALEEDATDERRELIWATVRELVDCVSDEALVPIASLTAERLHGQRPLDRFYRGAVRLLASLDTPEIGSFRELLSLIDENTTPAQSDLRIVFLPPNHLVVSCTGKNEEEDTQVFERRLPFNAVRLITLLKDNHLGYELVSVFGAAVVVDTERFALTELLRHVRPSTSSP